ncbi:hypothetical protein BX666DRAFT_2024295 [Dichotomocladium elegans]|nr:hypothetical protein BX666DRAFT_2024295 [Dichotomocladium elegans]
MPRSGTQPQQRQKSTPTSPELQLKLDKVKEKERELHQLEAIQQQSAQLTIYFEQLSRHFTELSAGAKSVSETFAHWDFVFRTMAMVNSNAVTSDHPTLVRLPIRNPDASSSRK